MVEMGLWLGKVAGRWGWARMISPVSALMTVICRSWTGMRTFPPHQ
jgi:hypothetical protein